MKLTFHNYQDDCLDYAPKFAINWIYINVKPKDLVKRNNYRTRVGFPKILDDGCYFTGEIWISRRRIGFEIEFRSMKLERV